MVPGNRFSLGEPLKLQPDDLRQKVREHKVSSLVVFLIDGSASMDADNRMATAKTVILNLLHDPYVRRDRVAAVVFRGRSAETVLQPTSSVSLARRHLEQMALGGATPLPHGLLAAYKLMNRVKCLDPTVRPLLVLVSDGNGNVSLGDADAKGESLDIAKKMARDGIGAIVVDSSPASVRDQGPMIQGPMTMYEDLRPKFCLKLAAQMQALYLPMNAMSAGRSGVS
jgi:Mg-chelatase subunit ChlD